MEFEQLSQEADLSGTDQTVSPPSKIKSQGLPLSDNISQMDNTNATDLSLEVPEAIQEDSESALVPVSYNSIEFQKPTAHEIQQALQNAGFYHGTVDGVIGPKTKKAIREFQEQNNLVMDGKVGPKTWSKLSSYINAPQQQVKADSGISY